ncbi:MAG: Ig-like domain repeat protein [Methanobrevibacter sp.]|nr:Ig-like domain repeat protein [Methanobrevibacter sp.]
MFFILLGAVSAAELSNVTSTESSNLIVNDEKLSIDNYNSSYAEPTLQSNLETNSLQSDSANSSQSSNTSASTNTTKVKTVIEAVNARYSKTATVFKITLKDANGNALANQSVSYKINGKTYKATTSQSGIAHFTTPAFNKGTYTITAKYNGDSQYIKSSISKKIKVASSIYATNKAISYGSTEQFSARFHKDNGNLIESNVKITLNGKTYTIKTDSKGYAKISLSTLLPGTYKIKLYNPYSKETITKTITVKKASNKFTASNKYILPKTKSSYSVVFKNSQGKALKNAKIYFTYNKKQVTAKTNANGEAEITISALSKGTYKITYQHKGNSKYYSVSGSKKLYVKDSTTTLKASNLKMQYNDGSLFSVKATNSAGKALSNKTIKFTLNGKTTSVTTDSDGVAKLAIGNLKPNTYTVKYSYSTAGSKDYNEQTSSVIISKQTVTITANDLVMKHNDGSSYEVTIKNKTGSNLNGVEVQFTLNGKATKVNTDENGVAKLAVTENIGYYPISAQVDTTYYTSSKVTKHVLVNGTKFTASDVTIPTSTAYTFQVKVLDGQDKPVATTIKFTLNNKEESVQTDTNGIAKLSISGLKEGKYTVTYTDGTTSGSSIITVVDKVTLKEIIAASQNVKKYIESNEELPNTVKIGSVTYSLAEYVYLASQAIINLNNNNKKDIAVKDVKDPSSPKSASNLGNLYDYVAVAKSIVNTCNSKGTMPDSVSSKVGTIGYKGLVYATARVVAFYDDYSMLPNYVSIKTYESSSSSSLNSKNTITNLAAYLKSSTNCQVGNSKIKSIVDSLTSGLTSDKAKATAIYNYVRDYVSYSFYYDTKYGAVGTLNAKTGNCVDQAHLLVAMYRTAGLAARYAHGTCYFTLSGSTYGHVWTQVLIGDTWIVGDPTSSRNSFGNVVNWNNNNYNLKGYYSSIAF